MEGRRSFDGFLQGLAIVPFWEYMKILVPLTIVLLFAFSREYSMSVGSERAKFLTAEAAVIQAGIRRVEQGNEIATGDLFFFGDLARELIDTDTELVPSSVQSVSAFLRYRPSYQQVQFINAEGREFLRAENTSDGPRIAGPNELQDTSGFDYFTGAMRLKPGEVFVSPIDAEVEGGTIAWPYRPVVRLAAPIDGTAGQRRGIVVLNAHGGHFLREFVQDSQVNGIQRMVVNSEGYWVQHRPKLETGLVLELGRSFQDSFPEIWPQLQAKPRGWVEAPEGRFYFDTVTPPPVASVPGGSVEDLPNWIFISWVPLRVLDEISVRAATPLLLLATPLFFTCLAIGCLAAVARNRQKLADEALKSAQEIKNVMMVAALDGIVVMDRKGITLEFNPSAQEIFGYSLEEARGKLVADLIIPEEHREAHRVGLEHFLETGAGRIIDKHVDELTAVRKNGEEFPVELTVCPVMASGELFFYGFLRDLSVAGREKVKADLEADPIPRALRG
ncbi:MAG: PAS domain S-box protein [bacterium]|nr:PAS domain S-box protein [bacterium]